MKTKKIIIYFFAITTFILGGMFLLNAKTIQAQTQNPDDLIIIFNPNPLFSEGNFLPGNAVSGFAEIKNKSGGSQQIITEAINIDDPDNLAEVFDLKIKDTGTTYFDGTLTEFFNTREVKLSLLANNASTTYEFLITFQPQAGDDYQGKKLKNFDIIIGFSGDEDGEPIKYACNDGIDNDGDSKIDYPADPGCASPTDGNEADSAPLGRSGGGGGGGPPRGLIILYETATTTMTTATVTWTTSYPATSQIIYSCGDEPHLLDLNALNYGYAHTYPNPEDTTKVTGHTVVISDLNPETYCYFRCISHASPATVSLEGFFTTKKAPPGYTLPSSPPIPETPSDTPEGFKLPTFVPPSGLLPLPASGVTGEGLAYTPSGNIQSPASGATSEGKSEIAKEKSVSEKSTEKTEEDGTAKIKSGFLAGAILPALKYFSKPFSWVFLLIALIILYLLFYKKKKKKEEDSGYKNQ